MAEPVVTVDGVECTVTEYDFYSIKCITSEKVLEDSESNYVGQHGLRRRHWDGRDHKLYFNTFENYFDVAQESLQTTLE